MSKSKSIERKKVEQTEGIDSESVKVKEIRIKDKARKSSIISVDSPTIHPECEGFKTQFMECLNAKMVDFADRKYNPIVAAEDGVTEDNYKVVVQFDINSFGEIVEHKPKVQIKKLRQKRLEL